MNETNKLIATATGMGASALWWFAQNEQDRNDRFRNLKADQRDTSDRLNELMSSGDWYRLTTSAVRDVMSGISTANAVRTAPTPIPTTVNQTRPDYTAGTNISSLSWPVQAAPYNSAGNPEAFAELAQAGQVFTFEEPRAWSQGLTLARSPSANTKEQIFLSAQGLSQTLNSLSLTLPQYQVAWTQLFTAASSIQPGISPHQDPSKAPAVGTLNANIASVTPMNPAAIPGYPYNNPNTDAGMRFRITTGAGNVPALATLFSVSFGSEYKWTRSDGAVFMYQPVVVCNGPLFFADSITPTGFTMRTTNALGASSTFDVFISVSGGVSIGTGG